MFGPTNIGTPMFTFITCSLMAYRSYSQGDHAMLGLMVVLATNVAATGYDLFWIGCRLDRLERLQAKVEEASP